MIKGVRHLRGSGSGKIPHANKTLALRPICFGRVAALVVPTLRYVVNDITLSDDVKTHLGATVDTFGESITMIRVLFRPVSSLRSRLLVVRYDVII